MNNSIEISLFEFDSPLGKITSGCTDSNLCILYFSEKQNVTLQNVYQLVDPTPSMETLHAAAKNQIDAYFSGNLEQFDLPLKPYGTEFQQNVWKALIEIPYGSTRSYKEQTAVLGDPLAIRAVATANGANPIAIVIPCHRVLGSNGSLTGYAGGLWRKEYLLEMECGQGRLF